MSENADTLASPRHTSENTADRETEDFSFRMDKTPESTVNLRAPVGLKRRIDEFIVKLNAHTGIHWTRTTYILNAIKFYTRYLMSFESMKDLEKFAKEKLYIPAQPAQTEVQSKEGLNEIRESSGETPESGQGSADQNGANGSVGGS